MGKAMNLSFILEFTDERSKVHFPPFDIKINFDNKHWAAAGEKMYLNVLVCLLKGFKFGAELKV